MKSLTGFACCSRIGIGSWSTPRVYCHSIGQMCLDNLYSTPSSVPLLYVCDYNQPQLVRTKTNNLIIFPL